MRRILQSSGAEVIHLGHNRSVQEIVNCAIQEDANAIAITSYQGGHMEFFKYMKDMLDEKGASDILIFGGGGGTILPAEMKELHQYGISRIYSPDDGRKMGLQGMITDMLTTINEADRNDPDLRSVVLSSKDHRILGKAISFIENTGQKSPDGIVLSPGKKEDAVVLGITGTGGAGKSSVVDELIRRLMSDHKKISTAIISVDPTKRKTGGALLGDRIRMNAIDHPNIYMRSMATRKPNVTLSDQVEPTIELLKSAGFDLIVVESSGIGQSDTEIVDIADIALYVMTPEFGAASQLEKIDMLDFADVIAINKFDKSGALDALRDVKKQYKRNHQLWETDDHDIPVFGTIAANFMDPGIDSLYHTLLNLLVKKNNSFKPVPRKDSIARNELVPSSRARYLAEISEVIRQYNTWANEQASLADEAQALHLSERILADTGEQVETKILQAAFKARKDSLDPRNWHMIEEWPKIRQKLSKEEYHYQVRGNKITVKTSAKSLSHLTIPKISLPKYSGWGDILRWRLQENLPGEFPFTAGVFPFKRQQEDPTRMFAGEGGPERTNHRFHYLSKESPAIRLSTAFDSVTLYGENPETRPDIFGKIGNSGVSVCCLDDAKKLYSGFDLTLPSTSVSMTINGPASIMTAFFMNAAIDQQCEKYIRGNGLEADVEAALNRKYDQNGLARPVYHGKLPGNHDALGLMLLGISGDEVIPNDIYLQIKKDALSRVRGTVQADILKEDQAQNTCIFSTEFSLKLMGDVQQYFIDHEVKNFYSVSVSGYHIAEAGANPITQLAFTLANGFTFLEYYRARGMNINDFAPNFSFFFSNGVDPEYAVIGRVARRIWAKALKIKYKANERAQKLKYHIQTSGRSLHAQEIDFNDIRTTLQALYAVYDNCNSLHTNAYDEAITTPTEESVRRAMAIQLIINKELGLTKNENPLQGSFIIEELTDLVEEAVITEFERISERGGVLGAMESMYQRSKIQEESMYYESLKHNGQFPVIGVNTFLSSEGSPTIIPNKITRADEKEKNNQIGTVKLTRQANKEKGEQLLKKLKTASLRNENTFNVLMEAVKYCTLGDITHALFEVGGQYRRNM